MTIDRNDGIAKVINALTAAVVGFKERDDDLYTASRDALSHVLLEVQHPITPHTAPLDRSRDGAPLIPWQPRLSIVEGAEWHIVLDDVQLPLSYQTHEHVSIAYFAIAAAIDRMRDYARSAADTFYQDQAAR
jgi:hypothetical protein